MTSAAVTARVERARLSALGFEGAALDFAVALGAGERHAARVQAAMAAARAAASVVASGDTEAGAWPARRDGIVAFALCAIEAPGLFGGRHGLAGIATARAPWARALGTGRRQARDGGAWTAAIAQAGRELAARALVTWAEPVVLGAPDGDGEMTILVVSGDQAEVAEWRGVGDIRLCTSCGARHVPWTDATLEADRARCAAFRVEDPLGLARVRRGLELSTMPRAATLADERVLGAAGWEAVCRRSVAAVAGRGPWSERALAERPCERRNDLAVVVAPTARLTRGELEEEARGWSRAWNTATAPQDRRRDGAL